MQPYSTNFSKISWGSMPPDPCRRPALMCWPLILDSTLAKKKQPIFQPAYGPEYGYAYSISSCYLHVHSLTNSCLLLVTINISPFGSQNFFIWRSQFTNPEDHTSRVYVYSVQFLSTSIESILISLKAVCFVPV